MTDTQSVSTVTIPAAPRHSYLVRRLFSFPVLLGVLLIAGTLAGRCLNIKSSLPHAGSFSNIPFVGDTWWHIVTGNRILSSGHWPLTDSYSFTVHGNPWIAYEWVGDVTLAFASRLNGLEGLMQLLLLISGAYVLLLYYYAYQRCRNAMAAFLACVALLPLASSFFTLRPQLLGYLFLILTLIILERFRSGRQKALWLLPVVFLIWVNTHGTFVFGFFVIGVYWAAGLRSFRFGCIRGEEWTPGERNRLEATFLLCLLASFASPYGSRLAAYPLGIALLPVTTLNTNSEFLPIRLNTLDGKLFVLLLLFFFVYMFVVRPTLHLEEVVIFSLAAFEASAHVRVLLLFVPVFAPLLARALGTWLPFNRNEQERPVLNAFLFCVAAVFLLKLIPTEKQLGRAIANNFPVAAVAFISRHNVSGPMFNEVTWGGYLIWSSDAKHPVFIDGREEIYDYAGILEDYFTIRDGGPRAFFLLKKYDVRSCLLSHDARLVPRLSSSSKWHEVYRDQVSDLFVQVTNPNAGISTEDIRKDVPKRGGER